jgi:hypothetical protein
VNTASLLAFNLGGHGAACGLFLLLACLSWRDGDASLAWRLTAALAFCVAANAMVTAPGFFPARYWQAPILALSWGAPALFWLWARAAFDDEFAPSFWHAAPWVALVCGGLFDAYDGVFGLPWRGRTTPDCNSCKRGCRSWPPRRR